MNRWLVLFLAILIITFSVYAAVIKGNLDVRGNLTVNSSVNFSNAASTTPMKAGLTLPATCTVGQAFFKTDATPGQNIYLCTSANTWTQVQGTGSSSTPNYSQTFSNQTSVTLTHNAATTAIIVDCYDSNNYKIIPNSLQIIDSNSVQVTFSTSQSGKCVVNSSGGGGGGGGGGGSVSWGSITGTLSNQTDLQNALNSKANSTHTHSLSDLLQSGATTGQVPQWNGTQWVPATVSGGGGTIYTSNGIIGDGSQNSPIRPDPNGPVASQTYFSASLNFGTINANSCVEQNITASGVSSGNTLAAGFPATLPNGIYGFMYSGTNVIVVRLCNTTGSGIAITNGLQYSARVIGGF